MMLLLLRCIELGEEEEEEPLEMIIARARTHQAGSQDTSDARRAPTEDDCQ